MKWLGLELDWSQNLAVSLTERYMWILDEGARLHQDSCQFELIWCKEPKATLLGWHCILEVTRDPLVQRSAVRDGRGFWCAAPDLSFKSSKRVFPLKRFQEAWSLCRARKFQSRDQSSFFVFSVYFFCWERGRSLDLSQQYSGHSFGNTPGTLWWWGGTQIFYIRKVCTLLFFYLSPPIHI